jgi:hypothetical protein
MKLFRLILLISLSLFHSSSAVKPADEIRWGAGRLLGYEDFKAAVPSNTPWAATTTSSIYFSYEESNKQLRNVQVYAFFNPEQSWMKTKSPEVLRHEQLHFNITEFYARKFYAESAALLGTANAREKLMQLFKKANDDCASSQSKYDVESEHGVNESGQKKWETQVAEWLKATAPYPTSR